MSLGVEILILASILISHWKSGPQLDIICDIKGYLSEYSLILFDLISRPSSRLHQVYILIRVSDDILNLIVYVSLMII